MESAGAFGLMRQEASRQRGHRRSGGRATANYQPHPPTLCDPWAELCEPCRRVALRQLRAVGRGAGLHLWPHDPRLRDEAGGAPFRHACQGHVPTILLLGIAAFTPHQRRARVRHTHSRRTNATCATQASLAPATASLSISYFGLKCPSEHPFPVVPKCERCPHAVVVQSAACCPQVHP